MAKDKSARPKSVIDLKLLNNVAKASPKTFRQALAAPISEQISRPVVISTMGRDRMTKQRKARLRQLMAPEQPV
jgi:hypothetical protein